MNKMSIKTNKSDADYMHGYVSEIGSFTRSPGSSGERKGAEMTAEMMETFSDEVKMEDFELAPKAAFGWIKIVVPLFFISLILFNLYPILSGLLMALSLFIVIGQFVFYKKIVDPFYPKKTSQNTYGVINPSEKAKQTIIFAGHIDSPYQFNFIKWWGGRVYSILMFFVLVSFFTFGILSIVNALLFAVNYFNPAFIMPDTIQSIIHVIWIVVICLSPLGALFFLFTTWVDTPGCGDNLSGVAVALGVGNALRKSKKSGGFFPKHTKVISMAIGSEEAFLRGAMAYVEAHRDELIAENTILINLETLVEPDSIFVITKDLNGTVKLSQKVAEEITKVSDELGLKAKMMAMPIGSGSTDSAAFAKAGIESTCIFGMDIGNIIKGEGYFNHYHTVRDTPDKVHPKVLQQTLDICLNYLKMKDEEVGK